MSPLNPSQEKAVRHFGRPLLVVAGAGSGKTKTLSHKVEFLIREKGIKPSRILALTFTNKAAREITERVEKVIGLRLDWSGTFHSVALRLLRTFGRRAGLSTGFTLIDEADRNRLVKKIAQEGGVSKELLKGYISRKMEDLEEPKDDKMEELFQRYVGMLEESNLLDFSGLMFYLYRLLRVEPEPIRNLFDFVLVDEFQDTNTVQYEILYLLGIKNICVVGDPNQCIYEWRYARPHNLLRFKEDFTPDVIKLQQNYRSKPYLIHIANALLSHSGTEWKELIPTLIPVRDGEEKPEVRRFEKEEEEALWIAKKVKELHSIYNLSDMAVLVRVSYITEAIERSFSSLGIPYKVVGSVGFFERAEVKDALSFLRVLANPRDEGCFIRALNITTSGFGEKSIELIRRLGGGNMLLGAQLALKELSKVKAQALYSFLREMSLLKREAEDYPKALEELLNRVGFWDHLKGSYKDTDEREENIRELFRYLKQKREEGYTLEDVLSDVSFISQGEEEKGVRIMTIHASKGLEFSVVFLPRLEEGILPHEKVMEEGGLEEELRLFYVAVTRARDRLFISYTRSKGRPSRFLSYIPKQYLDLSAFAKKRAGYLPELKSPYKLMVGQRVRHGLFGIGRVLTLEGSKATVEFPSGKKTIHTAFLEPVL
ncbi:MAG: ATP-dependent DNA helicase Rep [Acidobacteria bacterium]|jgi:DNA helicase-2/ATP-dependent DNA helicase PcrA|nr:MAG: ATP-dependent DNA helicase Rep [Acidobacteriota bacterium]